MKHHIERTSPKGQAFVGTCRLCGKMNLPMSAVHEDCENVRGLSAEEALIETMMGGSPKKRSQMAIRLRGNGFETVALDDAGNVVEPPPRCCYGTLLHAPNCKSWLTCT